MQILPLELFIMKHSISHSLKGRPYSIYYIPQKKKKAADVTKQVANYLQSRETGMLPLLSNAIQAKATMYC